MSPVKINFRLVQDEDGYPPVAVESLWAEPRETSGEYVIDNVPFFVSNVTLGDVVRVREEEGLRWFDDILSRSRNSLFRIVFFDRNCVGAIGEELAALGCSTEYLREHNLMAVNIPEKVALANVQAYLQSKASMGILDYEEPIIRQ